MAESQLSAKEQIQSIWSLGGLSAKNLFRRVSQAAIEDDLAGRASELAYNFIFAIFPLMLFLLSLFGLFANRGTQLENNLMFYLRAGLPPAGFQVLQDTIVEVTKNTSGGKLTFGILLTLWVASGGMNSMISTLNAVYSVRDKRPWWKVRIRAILLTVCLAVLVLSALAFLLVGGFVADWMGRQLGLAYLTVLLWKIVQFPVALLFIVVSFSLVYFYGPDLKEQHWYWITPGSLFGVLLWLAVSFGFRAYLHFFNSYSKTYGSLGAVIILLLWFYVTGLAFLAGGEINAQIEHAAAEHGHPEAKAEGKKAA